MLSVNSVLRGVADDWHNPHTPRAMAHHGHSSDDAVLCLGESGVLPVLEQWSLQNGKIHSQVTKFAGFILSEARTPVNLILKPSCREV